MEKMKFEGKSDGKRGRLEARDTEANERTRTRKVRGSMRLVSEPLGLMTECSQLSSVRASFGSQPSDSPAQPQRTDRGRQKGRNCNGRKRERMRFIEQHLAMLALIPPLVLPQKY